MRQEAVGVDSWCVLTLFIETVGDSKKILATNLWPVTFIKTNRQSTIILPHKGQYCTHIWDAIQEHF
jgi:hypothetical protein